MIERRFEAMGTTVESWCDDAQDEDRLEALFEEVEAICSRFRPGSELSRLNMLNEERISVSPTLAEVLRAAQAARTMTGGLVDVGVGESVRRWGYSRTFSEVVDVDSEPVRATTPEWAIKDGALVRSPGTVIDLGGIAKGWTCDRAVADGLALVVSAGGDLRSVHDQTTVGIADAGGSTVARVVVGVGALATSSTAKRRWSVAGREVSHLIDPRTMAPVRTPVTSATVVAGTALEAEAGAKAVLLLGKDGLAWADEQSWIRSALVIWHDDSVYATSSIEIAA